MKPTHTFEKKLLTCMIAMALSGAVLPAMAEENPEADQAVAAAGKVEVPEEDIEHVEVTGFRMSQKLNLYQKKSADSIKDVINAEDIGKFPDKNVAESLQRIPGVAIQRQWGEGAGVSVRGVGEDLTLTTLNGQSVASTGWFVFEPARRSFNYSLLPSEMVGAVEVYKSSQADLKEGGVGGTINIKTRKPLDMKANTFFGSVEGQYSEDSEEWDPAYSGMGSWKNEGESFGVLVAYSASDRTLQRNGNEAFWQWGAGPVAFVQDRNREAVDITAQFAPTEKLDFTAHYLDMEMEADNTNYALWLTQADAPWLDPSLTQETLASDPTVPVKAPLGVAFYQARPREATMKSKVYDFTTKYTDDAFNLNFQLGHTEASGGTDFETVFNDGTGGTPIPGGSYDFTGSTQHWNLNGFNTGTYVPPTLGMGTGGEFNKTPKTDEEDYLQLDAQFFVEWGAISSVKTGIASSDHEVVSKKVNFLLKPGSNTSAIPTANFNSGTIDAGTAGYPILQVDADGLKNYARSLIAGEQLDQGSYNKIEEDNNAAYVMFNFEDDKVRGNFGFRYVSTDAEASFYTAPNTPVSQLTTADNHYSEILPSVNVAFDLTDDKILRFAAARVMSRPQYVDMYMAQDRSGVDPAIPTNPKLITGSVALDPYLANEAEIAFEWYVDDNTMFSAGLFTKDIESFIAYETTFDVFIDDPEDPGLWDIQQKVNGKGGQVDGIEVQYQQSFDNGFGFSGNLTYAETDAPRESFDDRNAELADSSEWSYNLSGFYEDEMFSARMSYNWRDDYILREVGAYGSRLNKAYGTLDASFIYHVTENVDLKLEAINLTGEGLEQVGNNNLANGAKSGSGFSPDFPLYQYDLGARYIVGASVRF